jgi:hypothetical protein
LGKPEVLVFSTFNFLVVLISNKKRMKKVLSLFLAVSMLATMARADEGMWLLTMLNKNYQQMKAAGFKLTAEDIYSLNKPSLKDAIVQFGGGCTAEIISNEGLLLTNHHCGYGSIQALSSVEHDYLKDGFWAYSKEEELPAKGLSVTFLVKIEDVTAKTLDGVTAAMTEKERETKIKENADKISAEAKKGNNYTATVRNFFGGNFYYLMLFENYNDVRLVGTPPSSIGKFGADTDNWMWPRHTGDFSMFRIYMGKDGKPAEYSKDNVPLKPKRFLSVSTKGVNVGDYSMVMGFPGRTNRYIPSYGVDEIYAVTNPIRVAIRGAKQDIWWKDMMASDKVRIQYSSKYAGSSNYWKYSIGQNQGLKRLKVIENKQKLEAEFSAWVNADPARKEKYGNVLDMMKKAYEGRRPYTTALNYITESLVGGAEIFTFGYIIANMNPMMMRGADPKSYIRNFYKNYNLPTDKKVVAEMLKQCFWNVSSEYRPSFYEEFAQKYKGDFDAYTDYLFSNTMFTDSSAVLAYIASPDPKKLENDPVFKAAKSIFAKRIELAGKEDQYSADIQKGLRLYIAGTLEKNPNKTFAPDANSTMRVTYGKVGNYKPKDAVTYDYYTTLDGVMDKEDSTNYEFVVPKKLKELYAKKDFGGYTNAKGEMVVCFTTNNDITGGNSGSPVMNAKGELIGAAFDGNWEAMSGDIAFETNYQKCIVVDIRYVLFIIDKYAGAKNLIKEMNIVK